MSHIPLNVNTSKDIPVHVKNNKDIPVLVNNNKDKYESNEYNEMDQSNRNECDKKSPITGNYDATYHTCPLYSDILLKVLKSTHGLKIAHLNTRSLRSAKKDKISQIRLLLSDHSIDIFAISETWWTAEISNDEVNIDGYSLYRKDREHPAGGVALYVKSSIPHEFSSELTEKSNIEAVWVKIMVNNVSPFIVCSFYRKPSADKKYFDNMIEHFELAMS